MAGSARFDPFTCRHSNGWIRHERDGREITIRSTSSRPTSSLSSASERIPIEFISRAG
jgi:hypothetical protein